MSVAFIVMALILHTVAATGLGISLTSDDPLGVLLMLALTGFTGTILATGVAP